MNWPEDDFYADTVPLFKDILQNHPSLKVLIYSGDADAVCATVGTQEWIFRAAEQLQPLRRYSAKDLWQPWMLGNQKAGYLTKFGGHFSFMTDGGPANNVILQIYIQHTIFFWCQIIKHMANICRVKGR